MSKVKFESLKSAVVKMNNSVDVEKAYLISADVSVKGVEVGNISNGVVKPLKQETTEGTTENGKQKEEKVLATFNRNEWEKDNLHSSIKAEDGCDVFNAIKAFIADVEVKVAKGVAISL